MQKTAEDIISRFGGAYALAKILNIDVAWVYRWTYPKSRRGTGGRIPSEHHTTLLIKAPQLGVDLNPSDFFDLPKKDKKPKTRS